MQRSLSFDNQWEQAVNDINQLVQIHVSKPCEVDRHKGKSFWTAAFNAKKCVNQSCQTHFGLFERPRKCHRCGDLFCKQCTSYERRLNSNGNFDPAGRLFKTECRRLCDGFLASLKNLGIGQSISDVFGVAKPEWEKSPALVYGKMAERCLGCQIQFGLLQRRHNCVICGASVCEKCSSRDLVVYVPDEDAIEAVSSADVAKLAVIRVVGCPEKEPNYCRYLRVCEVCSERVQSRQIAEYQALVRQPAVDEVNQTWLSLGQVNEQLRNLQMKIDENLPKYCELLELLDVGTRQLSACPKRKNNMQILAKSQGDLSDHFAQFVTTISSVKHLKPSTNGQMKVLRNIIQGKVEYYHENMAEFRSLQRQLESVVPPESLIIIQNCVDKNAINSCYISVKQLIFEVIHICQKHQLEDTPATNLIPLEEVTRQELQSYVDGSWEEHAETVAELLRYQLAEHRLVRVSSASDKSYVTAFTAQRIQFVLQTVLFQLVTKSSDGKFQATKSLLMKLTTNSKIT